MLGGQLEAGSGEKCRTFRANQPTPVGLKVHFFLIYFLETFDIDF